MPFAQKTSSLVFPVIYNVEQAVGSNAPNRSGDARLVQYMLANYYKTPGLAVDGFIGPVMNNWIKKFQADMAKAGNNVLQDGRIDRALGKQSSVSKTVYSMLLLNFALRRANPAAFAQIPQAVPLSSNPAANPHSQGTEMMGGIKGIIDSITKTVKLESTSNGIQVTETGIGGPGTTGTTTTVYTIPYFTG